jgi:hypothetical protein
MTAVRFNPLLHAPDRCHGQRHPRRGDRHDGADSNVTVPGIPYEARSTWKRRAAPQRDLLISSRRTTNNAPCCGIRANGTPTKRRCPSGTGRRRVMACGQPLRGWRVTPDGTTLYTINEDALARRFHHHLRRRSQWHHATTCVAPGSGPSRHRPERFRSPGAATGFADSISAMIWIRHVLPRYDLLVMSAPSAGPGQRREPLRRDRLAPRCVGVGRCRRHHRAGRIQDAAGQCHPHAPTDNHRDGPARLLVAVLALLIGRQLSDTQRNQFLLLG